MKTAPGPGGQWPRWEVFKQDAPGNPHQAVGSVHAADPEHALVTARHVFVRRPRAVSLWVAPAEAVFSVTREELGALPTGGQEAGTAGTYVLFAKPDRRPSMTFVDHVGEIAAATPAAAIRAAVAAIATLDASAWWAVPLAALTRSEPGDVESWFAPADGKTYKQQSAYGSVKAKGGA